MSTLVKDRKQSVMQFIYIASEIFMHTRKYYKKLKVLGAEYRSQIVDYSSKLLFYVTKANKIPLNEEHAIERLGALNEAVYTLTYLKTIVSLFQTLNYEDISPYCWKRYGELFEEESKLLKGCIDKIKNM